MHIRYNLGWDAMENNHFGTEEFMLLCSLIGTEPYLCCNIGTGTVEEARSWAEYCNCDKDTELTRKRAENGSPSPYHVKYWGIGNEPYYCLDGMMTTSMYTEVYRRYAGYVKRFASQDTYQRGERYQSTKLLAAISDQDFLKNMELEYVDLIAAHIYSDGKEIDEEHPVNTYDRLMSDLGRIRKEVERCCLLADTYSTPEHGIDVAVDEWGTWHWKEATPLNGLKQSLTLQDAVFAAACLHIFHENKKVAMANMAQTVNVLQALIQTHGKAFVLSPTYYIYEMFKPHKGATVVEHVKDSGLSLISVCVTKKRNQSELTISIVNTDPVNNHPCRLRFSDITLWKLDKAVRLHSSGIRDVNSFEDSSKVVPTDITHEITNDAIVSMYPHSVVVLSYGKQ